MSEKNTGNPVNRTECGEVLMLGEVAEASALLQVIAEDRPPGDYSVKGAINRAARRVSRFLPRGKSLSVSRTEDLWRQEAKAVRSWEMDAIRAVVPQIPELIGNAILASMKQAVA